MKFSMAVLVGAIALSGVSEGIPQEFEGKIAVEQIQRFSDDANLQSITSTELSPDGKFVYAAAFNSDTATVWKRNSETGKVTHVQTLTEADTDGLLALRMSPDGKYLAGASIKNVVTLYSRNETSGELALLSAVRPLENGAGSFDFPIEVRFSDDSRFVYAGCSGSLEVFRVEENELKGIQSETAIGRISSIRDVDVSPDGKFVYTAGNDTLVVFSRDPETGIVTHSSDLVGLLDNLSALNGINSVCCSSDNQHVYVSSGRFVDHSSVIVLKRKTNGSLEIVETWMNPKDDGKVTADVNVKPLRPGDFSGGNEIEITADGTAVWVLGTESDTVVRFRRDPETGRLELQQAHLVAGGNPAIGPAGLCFSKDGRFCYVADEKEASLVVFERKVDGER